MGRAKLFLAVTSLALAVMPVRVAWGAPTSLEVFTRLNCSSVSGRIAPDLPLTITVSGAGGVVKGFAAVTSSGGSFDIDFSQGSWPFMQIVPGDTVTVDADGAQYKHTLSRITLISLDPATGVVSGQVTPRRPTVNVYQSSSRLTATGWQGGWVSREDLPTSPAGVFSASFAKLRRLDNLSVEYTVGKAAKGAFTVYHEVEVPGLDVTLGASIARLHAERGRTFEGRLANLAGAVKGVSQATTTNTYDDDEGVFDFRTAAGDPVAIIGNDRLAVTGRWSFSALVPAISLSLRVLGDRVTGRTRPNGVVGIDLWLLDDAGGLQSHEEAYVAADGTGAFAWTAAGDIRPGDQGSISVVDGQGNIFRRYAAAAPVK